MSVALTAQSGATKTAHPPTRADADFAFEVVARDEVVESGIVTNSVEDDKLIETETGATVDHHADITLSDVVPGTLDKLQVINLDEGIATATPNGLSVAVDRVSDGTARILLRTPLLTRRADVTVSRETPTTVTRIAGGTPGSARKAATDAIDDAIAGTTPSAAKPIFTTQNHAGGVYVRNTDCWAAELADLTCISPWNSNGGVRKAGTAITKRHVIGAEHYQIPVGATIRFIAADNTVVDRTIIGKASVGPSNATDGYDTDQTVYVLDSDLPASITPCKVLPDNWADYFPEGATTSSGERIPVLALDQEEKALVDDVRYLANGGWYSSQVPTDATRASFHESKISGDSGNPVFMILGGELVLLTTWTYGGAGSGPAVHALKTQINTAIAAADSNAEIEATGYELDEVELSGYANYAYDRLVKSTSGRIAYLPGWTGASEATDLVGDLHGIVHTGVIEGERPARWSYPAWDMTANATVEIEHDEALDFTDEMTLIIWAKFNALPENMDQLVGRPVSTGPTEVPYRFDYASTTGLRFGAFSGATFAANVDTSVAEMVGEWVMLAGTFDRSLGSNNIKCYLNGVLDGTANHTSPLPVRESSLFIGGEDGRRWVNAQVARVSLFDRALSPAEITALYTAGIGT